MVGREPVHYQPAFAGRVAPACTRPACGGPHGAGCRDGLGRDADPRAPGQHPQAPAAHARPLWPPHRCGGVPPQLPRADGRRAAPRPARHALVAPGHRPRACGARGGLHAVYRGGAVHPLPGVDELRRHACLAGQRRRVGRLEQRLDQHAVRPAPGAVLAEIRAHHGHGHDREAGRIGRARQHHPGRARWRRCLGRALSHHGAQVVLFRADVRCVPGPGAGARRTHLLFPAACAAR